MLMTYGDELTRAIRRARIAKAEPHPAVNIDPRDKLAQALLGCVHPALTFSLRLQAFLPAPTPYLTASPTIFAPESPPKPPHQADRAARLRLIRHLVARHYSQPEAVIIGHCRRKPIVLARHVAQWLSFRLLGLSMAEIGRRYKVDHTSVIFAVRKIDAKRKAEVAFASELDDLTRRASEKLGLRSDQP